jgi:hypothetical protein
MADLGVKFSELPQSTPENDDVVPSSRGTTNVGTTWAKVYTWIKAQLDLVYSTIGLGETSGTAYRGDRGKTAYDHSQATHAPSNAVSLSTVKADTDIASAISLKHASGSDNQDLSGYALKNNVLELNNTTPFTPDSNYEPATKKYVDDNSVGGHTQGTDQGLDTGGANAVTAAQAKAGYTHSGTTHAPSDAVSLATVKGDADVADAISKKHASGSDAETANSIATIINGISEDTIADADTIPWYKASGGLLKKITWANLVSAIRTAFFGSTSGILKANGSGVISATTAGDVMTLIWQSPPATKTSAGTAGWIAKDNNYLYICTATNVWERVAIATNW